MVVHCLCVRMYVVRIYEQVDEITKAQYCIVGCDEVNYVDGGKGEN